jgi:hypothetical protein
VLVIKPTARAYDRHDGPGSTATPPGGSGLIDGTEGVGEERGTGRANSLTTVDAAEGTQRRRLSGRYERTVRP